MYPAVRRRNTRQRQVILEELRRLRSHPSATALYEVVRRRLPNISLGTVYRNLDLLARTGAIQKLNTGQNEARFDGILERHYHICCVSCGRVDDLLEAPADLIDDRFGDTQGYEILGHQLQFMGVCSDCKGKKLH